ncbi:hypothetical protein ABT300_42115 [Streptomyces sp. NPDC001027]|uniref:hypothetical protein n=1 Tax=Streptomyces sp. NPDC001027 TaxID=3154771 RepID=UPI0033285B39
MERAPGAGRRRSAAAVRHLVHLPRSRLYPVAAVPDVEQEFVPAGELAYGLLPFGEHHDLRSRRRVLREAGEFLGATRASTSYHPRSTASSIVTRSGTHVPMPARRYPLS